MRQSIDENDDEDDDYNLLKVYTVDLIDSILCVV